VTLPATREGARRALFVSDVHLSEAHPATIESFFAFLDRVGGPAGLDGTALEALYILGDLFEYWAGDDDLDEPLNRRIVGALDGLTRRGMAVYLLTGNRDLLLGTGFAGATGVTLLSDPTALEVAGQRALISHGDALCTDDLAYQAYRTMVRSPDWQKSFLDKPLVERKELIESLREASVTAKASKASAIMDVNPQAVEALFRASEAELLIHGHTQRPARHRMAVDGIERQRWVLPDWDAETTPARGGGLYAGSMGLCWVDSRAGLTRSA
jgi:UDP-2,3-diacylglucosamine hydrolase